MTKESVVIKQNNKNDYSDAFDLNKLTSPYYINSLDQTFTFESFKEQTTQQGFVFDNDDIAYTTIKDSLEALTKKIKVKGISKGIVGVGLVADSKDYYDEEAETYGDMTADSIGHAITKAITNFAISTTAAVKFAKSVGSIKFPGSKVVGAVGGFFIGIGTAVTFDQYKITDGKNIYDLSIREFIDSNGGFSKVFSGDYATAISYEDSFAAYGNNSKPSIDNFVKTCPIPKVIDLNSLPAHLFNEKTSGNNTTNIAKATNMTDPTTHYHPDYAKIAFDNSNHNVKESIISQLQNDNFIPYFTVPFDRKFTYEDFKQQSLKQGLIYEMDTEATVYDLIRTAMSVAEEGTKKSKITTKCAPVVGFKLDWDQYYKEEAKTYGEKTLNSYSHANLQTVNNHAISGTNGSISGLAMPKVFFYNSKYGKVAGTISGTLTGGFASNVFDNTVNSECNNFYDFTIRKFVDSNGGFSKIFSEAAIAISYEDFYAANKNKYVNRVDTLVETYPAPKVIDLTSPTAHLSNYKTSINEAINEAKSVFIKDPTIPYHPDYAKQAFASANNSGKDTISSSSYHLIGANNICTSSQPSVVCAMPKNFDFSKAASISNSGGHQHHSSASSNNSASKECTKSSSSIHCSYDKSFAGSFHHEHHSSHSSHSSSTCHDSFSDKCHTNHDWGF